MKIKKYELTSEIVNVEKLIQMYDLKPHVEGGFAQLFYADNQIIKEDYLPDGFKGDRPLWNAIYYLLPKDSRCTFHKIKMDELWNFYLGGPLELFDISISGKIKKTILGNDISAGQQLAYVFPKNHWIGARPIQGFEFSFVSCVTCPGFTFAEWEKGDRQKLLDQYSHLQEIIIALT